MTLTIADDVAVSLKPAQTTGNPNLEGLTNAHGDRTDATLCHDRTCSAAE
jgi:hypothetical protein